MKNNVILRVIDTTPDSPVEVVQDEVAFGPDCGTPVEAAGDFIQYWFDADQAPDVKRRIIIERA